MWILQQRWDLGAVAGCGKRLILHCEVSVSKQTETVKSKDRGHVILTGNSKVQNLMPAEAKNRRCRCENRAWKRLGSSKLQREQQKIQQGCQGLGLNADNCIKQNINKTTGCSISASPAGYHKTCQTNWSRDGGRTEAADRKKMDSAKSRLSLCEDHRAQTQRCVNVSGCKVHLKVNVLGSIITTWHLQMRAQTEKQKPLNNTLEKEGGDFLPTLQTLKELTDDWC